MPINFKGDNKNERRNFMKISTRGKDVDIYATVEEINAMISGMNSECEDDYYRNYNKEIEDEYIDDTNRLIDRIYAEILRSA